MIHLAGEDLVRQIDETELAPGSAAFWWLGQHSFILKLNNTVIYLDPFLTDMPERRVPPLLAPQQVSHAAIILGSHDHGDHIDRPAWPLLANASPQATFVVPELLRKKVASELAMPPDRLRGLDDGWQIELDGIRITGVAAAHEFLDRDSETGLHPYLGFIIEADGLRVYHAGDTCRYEGLANKLRAQPIDVAFLPINGRDAERFRTNIVGNMTYQEAADLAGECEFRYVVPAHHDMFQGNLADPSAFHAYVGVKHSHVTSLACDYGHRMIVRKAA